MNAMAERETSDKDFIVSRRTELCHAGRGGQNPRHRIWRSWLSSLLAPWKLHRRRSSWTRIRQAAGGAPAPSSGRRCCMQPAANA